MTPFLGEIRMFAGNFAPLGWVTCDGQSLQISQYNALFQLIGTTYGGDGVTTFNVPNLVGGAPIHQGGGFAFGQQGGASAVAVTSAQLPAHSHQAIGDFNAATTTFSDPTGSYYGTVSTTPPEQIYAAHPVTVHPMVSLASSGGGQTHNNMQPYIAITYIIATNGVPPGRN